MGFIHSANFRLPAGESNSFMGTVITDKAVLTSGICHSFPYSSPSLCSRFQHRYTLVSLVGYFTVKNLNSILISFCICPRTIFFVVTKGIAFTTLKLDTLIWIHSVLASMTYRLSSFPAPSSSLSTADATQWHYHTRCVTTITNGFFEMHSSLKFCQKPNVTLQSRVTIRRD